MVRIEPTADASLAAMRERSRLGIDTAVSVSKIAAVAIISQSRVSFCFGEDMALPFCSCIARQTSVQSAASSGC